MVEPCPFREIPLSTVDLEDYTFAFPGGDLTKLLTSIKEVGLLNPPWLRERHDGRWQAVTGMKRLSAMAELDLTNVTARVLPTATPDSYCLLVGLFDNAFTRDFNLWEQATLARRLTDYWDHRTVAVKFLQYLGLPPSAAHLDRLLRVSTLEAPYQELCAAGRIALTAAATLAGWPAASRAEALPFLKCLNFSQSKQEQFLEDIEILGRRERVTAVEILSRQPLVQLLHDTNLDRPTRTEKVRQLFRRWVNPRYSAAMELWQEILGRLGLKSHPRIHLQAPPAFEGPDFHLEIKFRDREELRNLLHEIESFIAQKDFVKLTRL